MARQAVPRPSKSKRETPRRPTPVRLKFTWGGRQWEVAGVLLVALAVFTVVALFRLTPGRLSDGWADLLRRLFGWGAFIVPLILGVVGWQVFRHGQSGEGEIDWLTVVEWKWPFAGC